MPGEPTDGAERPAWWRRLWRRLRPHRGVGPGPGVRRGPWWAEGHCPDVETFRAYLSMSLPPVHAKRVGEHIAKCPACREDVAKIGVMLLRVVDDIDGVDMPALFTERQARRRAALFTAIAVVAAFPIGFLLGRHAAARHRDALLTAAALSGPADEAFNAGELRAVGVAQVIGGRVDPGIASLTRAVAAEPQSAESLNDLGAGLLARVEASERAAAGGDPPAQQVRDADLVAALELLDRALEQSPRLPEALFNRAYALEQLYLRASARKAWQEYLRVERDPKWAAEGRGRLAAIAVPPMADASRLRAEIAATASDGDSGRLADLVLQQRHLARRTVQEDLLPAWGDAWLAAEPVEAGRVLRAAHAIAAEWEAQTTDLTLLTAVAEVEKASGPRRERLARGYRALGEAARALVAFEIPAVRVAAERARRAFPATSPASTWARVHLLACTYYLAGDVESEAAELLAHAPSDWTSRGSVLWLSGLWRAQHGHFAQGVLDFQEAIDNFDRAEEREPPIWLRHLMGESYGYTGVSALGWREQRAATRDVGGLTDPNQPFAVFLASAMLALAEQRPRAAADFLDEALATPRVMEPYQAVQAFLWRSRIRLALGDLKEARDDYARAANWAPRLGATDSAWLSPELDVMRGFLAPDPDSAVDAFSKGLAGFRATGEAYRLPGVLLARAQAHERAQRYTAADEDLRQAAVLREVQQRTEYPQLLWTTPLEQPTSLSDERVRLALNRGRAEEAFAVAEASRDHNLPLGRRRGPGASARIVRDPVRLADLGSRLEPGTTMLFFEILEDRVVVWRIKRFDSSLVSLRVTPAKLSRMVSAFAADLQAGAWTASTRELAMGLYADLIEPTRLGSGPVVVIPDGELQRLPFAALVAPASKRFFIEERQVVVSPSATAYLAAEQQSLRLDQRAPVDAFVVGDPRLSRALFPDARPLPGAGSEARAVAAIYPRRELLLRTAATRAAFVEALGRHQVVHFSGPAVINRANPTRSSLPLAEDGGSGESLLFGVDIADLHLTHTRAVVLSACETASGRVLDGEGPLALAGAFLAAGAPSVVASLWPVTDRSTPLVTAFHRRLRNGELPAAALRSAQLTMLRSAKGERPSPAVWASFAAFGG